MPCTLGILAGDPARPPQNHERDVRIARELVLEAATAERLGMGFLTL